MKVLLLLLLLQTKVAAPPIKGATLPSPEVTPPNGPFVVTVNRQATYDPTKTYDINDLVLYEGNNYVALAGGLKSITPSAASAYWMLLPDYKGTDMAGWGMTSGSEAVVNMGGKHFKSATSYTCALTSDLLTSPSSPGLPGSKPPATKAKFTYQSGSQFTISKAPPTSGYICAGQ